MKRVLFFGLLASVAFSACKKSSTTNQSATDISGIKTISVAFDQLASQPFTLFRFSDSSVIANTDSASNNWDFGIRFTTFIVNSYAGGPGNAGVIMQNNIFDSVKSAPTSGYAYDTTSAQRAIKDGSWYTYNSQSHVFVPKAGKVFIFKTADGSHYAKMELLSVENGPVVPPAQTPTILYYTFRYSYKANGSPTF